VIALVFIERGDFECALITLLSEDGYLRESDWATVSTQDVSVRWTPDHAIPDVGMNLGTGARGLSTKTGSDQGITVDAPLLCLWLACLLELLPTGSPIVLLTATLFRKFWWQVLELKGIEFLGPPHGLRHSRPSGEVYASTRSLEGIRRRGRWISLKSVQRHTKVHTLVARLASLPPDVAAQGARFFKSPKAEIRAAILKCPASSARAPARQALEKALRLLPRGSYREDAIALSAPGAVKVPAEVRRAC